MDRYDTYTDPAPETVRGVFETSLRILAPVAPHIAEELWSDLGHEQFVLEADWPTFDGDLDELTLERKLVEEPREDIRQIIDVADITDSETIEIVVAPKWKFEAHSIAREFDGDNLVGEIMRRETFRTHDDAPSVAKDLQADQYSLNSQLHPEREATVLEQASWLIEQEFDATVTIRLGDDVDDRNAKHAEPGRSAIQITE